jgi:hypothetical protein
VVQHVAEATEAADQCDVMQYVTDGGVESTLQFVTDGNELMSSSTEGQIIVSGNAVNIVSQLTDNRLNLMEVQMVDSENLSLSAEDQLIDVDNQMSFVGHVSDSGGSASGTLSLAAGSALSLELLHQ